MSTRKMGKIDTYDLSSNHLSGSGHESYWNDIHLPLTPVLLGMSVLRLAVRISRCFGARYELASTRRQIYRSFVDGFLCRVGLARFILDPQHEHARTQD